MKNSGVLIAYLTLVLELLHTAATIRDIMKQGKNFKCFTTTQDKNLVWNYYILVKATIHPLCAISLNAAVINMSRNKAIQDVFPHKHVSREKSKNLPSQEWFCLTILLTNNVNRVKNCLESISSRHHVWLYPENQQQKYEEMRQGQLPFGWHVWKVESKKKPHGSVHELSYFNKAINNEVNKIVNRCLHCGTTLHWHLKQLSALSMTERMVKQY